MSSLSIEALFKSELPEKPSMRDVFDFCKRHDILALAQGMIELPPPRKLREAAATLMASDEGHQYRSRRGEPEYLNAIQEILKTQYATNVPQEALLATSGVTGAIFGALQMANKRGVKKIGLTNPYYTYHARHISMATDGAEPVFVKLRLDDNSFDWDWNSLEEELVAGMGAFILCNPGNPSGKVYSRSDLERVVEMTGRHNCFLILDEIYADLIWEGNSFYSPVMTKLHRHVISCRGFSKNVACQSWRIGYLISHPDTVAEILAFHDPIYISVPILQHAMASYLRESPQDYALHIATSNGMMQRNLAKLAEVFSEVLSWTYIQPSGSMYAMFRHSEKTDLEAVMVALKRGVGVAAGSMFFEGFPECSGFIRIHVGLEEHRVDKCVQILRDSAKK